jgi:hypothetical protein
MIPVSAQRPIPRPPPPAARGFQPFRSPFPSLAVSQFDYLLQQMGLSYVDITLNRAFFTRRALH